MLLVARGAVVGGVAEQREVVLDDDTIVNHRDGCRTQEFPIILKPRCLPDDVVAIPLARFPHGVDQRRGLFIDRGGLTVEVGCVVVRVENLDLIGSKKEATVASCLAAPLRGKRG